MSAAALQQIARRLGPAGIAAVLCGIAGLVVLLMAASTLLSAVSVPSAALVEQAEKERKENEDKFRLAFDGHLQQINGRSLFLVPGRPPAKEPPPTTVVDTGPKEPPKPTTYGGPSVIGMINGIVWFNDGKKLAPGEGDSELKVVELKSPWGAVVKWKDVEFTVGLFDRDSVVNPPPKPAKPPEPTEAMMGPEAPADAFDDPGAPARPKPGDAAPAKPGEPNLLPAPPPRPPEQSANPEPPALPPADPPAAPPPSEPARDTPPESR